MKYKIVKKICNYFILIVCMILFMQLLSYYRMYKDTDSLVEDYYDVIYNSKKSDIDYGELLVGYDYSDDYNIESIENVDLERDFVEHNYYKGYMDVRCSYKINLQETEIPPINSCRYTTRWYIEKINGRWRVYAIYQLHGALMVRVGTGDGSEDGMPPFISLD